MGYPRAGATGVAVPIWLRSTADNLGLAAVAHTAVTAYYSIHGAAPVSITMSAGIWFEVFDAPTYPGNREGEYKFTLPDAMFPNNAAQEYVVLTVNATGAWPVKTTYSLRDELAIIATVVEGQQSVTLQQSLQYILSACAGETQNNGRTFLTPDGVKTRITGTVDANNNRTAITLNST